MQQITFSQNWNNKLYQNFFTTFRPWWSNRFKPGEKVNVVLNFKTDLEKEFTCTYHFAVIEILYQVPETLCFLDTGYSKKDFIELVKTMYKNKSYNLDVQPFAFMLFERDNKLKINAFHIV
jgi:hypothetical protein